MKKLIFILPLVLLLAWCSNWKWLTNVECSRFIDVSMWSWIVIEESENFVMVSWRYEQYQDTENWLKVIYSWNGIISFEKSKCNRGWEYLKDELNMLEYNYKEKKYNKSECKSMFMWDWTESTLNNTIQVLYYPKSYFLTKWD